MAQRRRKEQLMKRRQRQLTIFCIVGGISAMLLSFIICLIVFDIHPESGKETAPAATSLPYDSTKPFTISDLTSSQLNTLRAQGRLSVSDGPRGISIGESLDTLLSRYPSTYTNVQTSSELTGEQSNEEMILYCSQYFENANGIMTALPPRGLITVDSGEIIVTLMAPTSAYPAGTLDNYRNYEHVYCIYTIAPDTMTVKSIVLGISK